MNYVIPLPPAPAVPVHGGGLFPVRRIYCVGRNYVEHAQEMGFSGREPPFFFMKPGDAVLPVAEGTTGVMTLTRRADSARAAWPTHAVPPDGR